MGNPNETNLDGLPKYGTGRPGPGRPVGVANKTPFPTRDPNLKYDEFILDTTDQAILRIEMENPGLSHVEAAKRLHLTDRMVSRRRKRAVYQQAMSELRKDSLEIIKDIQKRAARVAGDLLSSTNEEIRLQTVQMLLKPLLPSTTELKAQIETSSDLKNMTMEQLEAIVVKGVDSIGSRRPASRGESED